MKNGQILLTEKSKEELIEEILRLREENENLRKKLESKEKIEARKKELKFARASQRILNPKMPGQKKGHKGLTRTKPAKIDRTVEQTLAHCPDCHHVLGKSIGSFDHIQEDIIPAKVEVTCFKKHRYYCPDCEKIVTSNYAPEEVPHGYLGPNILTQTAILKYHHGLPYNKIRELFEALCQLKVSEGALSQALSRMSEWLSVETEAIKAAIRASPHIHMDETGWKVNGTNHWLWAAVNSRLAYYKIDRSRGSKVVKSILPEDCKGIVVSDFYSAYNRLGTRKQKCIVHLLREMKRCLVKDESEEYVKYYKILRQIIDDALCLKEKRDQFSFRIYLKKVSRLRKRLLAWAFRDYGNKNLARLANRFVKHASELLTFLEERDIPADNNLAERMIRHHVILRNRSFQNRSEKGARTHETLMSLLHTTKLQKLNPLTTLKNAFLKHRQGIPTPVLSF